MVLGENDVPKKKCPLVPCSLFIWYFNGTTLTNYEGSSTNLPKTYKDQIKRLEDMFTVPAEKLKQITDHFVKELTKGLTTEGGSIVSAPMTSIRTRSDM